MWHGVCEHLRKDRQFRAKRYNRGRVACKYKVGDLVWVKAHNLSRGSQGISSKLSYRWKGPFIVDKFLTKVTVRVVDPEDPASVSRAHLSQIKPAFHD